MPVKSAPKKVKAKKVAVKEAQEESEEMVPVMTKAKIAIEVDEPELGVEEKNDEEIIGADEEESELGLDDAGLDEELDPFNDKWEN